MNFWIAPQDAIASTVIAHAIGDPRVPLESVGFLGKQSGEKGVDVAPLIAARHDHRDSHAQCEIRRRFSRSSAACAAKERTRPRSFTGQMRCVTVVPEGPAIPM